MCYKTCLSTRILPQLLQKAQTSQENVLNVIENHFLHHLSSHTQLDCIWDKQKLGYLMSMFQVVPSFLPSASNLSARRRAAVGSLGHTSGLHSKQ